ncbi:TPA: TcfC E-set like domain-containing protein [Vibrio campbellii]
MKFKFKYASISFAIACQLYSSNIFATGIPEGFEEHFKLQETFVKFRNLDGSFSELTPVLSSFKTLKIDKNNKESLERIEQYLNDNDIQASYHEEIMAQLLNGVDDKSQCLGKIEDCEIFPETFEIVQNYNDREVYLFVSPKVLDLSNSSHSRKYHDPKSSSNGLINSFDLYLSAYHERDSIVSLNDDVTLGLPYGYLRSDFNLTNGDSGSELYEAAYHLDFDAYTLKAGHFEYDPMVNSTDYLNNTARLSQNSVSFGSSEKLLVGGKNSNKVLSFYVPASGLVQVYRGERIIYQANVPEGQNSISYSELPAGRYEARVDVTTNGQVVNSQVFQVYNSANDTLTEGSVDYVVSAGLFAESYYDYENSNVSEIKDDAYGRALINYQVLPSLQVGAGTLLTDRGSMYSLGANYYLLDAGLVLEGVHSQFDNAAHSNVNLGLPWFNVSYEALDNDEGDPVASHMYGYTDYSRWSLNSSYNFGQGRSIYAIYTRSDETFLGDQFGIGSLERETNLISVGYSAPAILDSQLNVNFDYSDVDESTNISVLWSVPLSDSMEAISSISSDTETLNQLRTSVRKSDLLDSTAVNTALEIGNTYNRDLEDMYQDASLSADGYNDYARMNALAYVSSQDSTRGINAGLSSTQIVTAEGAYITKDRSQAYSLVEIEDVRGSENDDEIIEKGYLTLARDGKTNSKFIVYDNEQVVPLRNYHEYDTNFDSQSVNLYNSGESKKTFYTHPGTVSYLSPKVSRVVSFVTAFSDISDKPITDIKCEGIGCLEVSEMAEGVYRVTVLEGLDFELTSAQNECLLPYEFTSTTQLNFGQNYCLPIAESNEVQQIEIDDERFSAIFLGSYEKSEQLQNSVEKLKRLGYRVIQKDIGTLKAVYIAHKASNMADMLASHEKEIETIKLLAKRLYKTNSISYPVAKVN